MIQFSRYRLVNLLPNKFWMITFTNLSTQRSHFLWLGFRFKLIFRNLLSEVLKSIERSKWAKLNWITDEKLSVGRDRILVDMIITDNHGWYDDNWSFWVIWYYHTVDNFGCWRSSENTFAGHWETVVDCMENIEKRQQWLILPKNCRCATCIANAVFSRSASGSI